jgi:hypothetical protein
LSGPPLDMHIPLTGIVFVPIIVLVFLLWPGRLEELLIYMAVFQAAAVVNLGGGFTFGLSPYFFTACLVAGRVTLRWITGKLWFWRGEFAQSHLQIAALFVAWCVLSAFSLPILFAGTPVDSPRAGAEAVFYLALPLKWSFSNAGQAIYMILNFFVLVALADFSGNRPMERLLNAFTYSGIIVVLVGLYQMASFHFNVPFPSSFFNSNGTWAQNYNQMISGGWHRVSATFVEPSEAGGFLSCWLLFELIRANWGAFNRRFHWLLAIAGSVVLLATTSSTGYVAVGVILAFMSGRLMIEIIRRRQILIRTGLTVAAIVLALAGFLALGHGESLLNSILWQKADSSSGVVRMATVWRALAVMEDTYGFGAGLGSNRAFGTFAYIGSNLGVFGLGVFCYMLVHLADRVVRFIRSSVAGAPGRVAIIACGAAFAANLIGIAVSGAEISDPRIWVLWGMVLASVRAQSNARTGVYSESTKIIRRDALYPTPIFN